MALTVCYYGGPQPSAIIVSFLPGTSPTSNKRPLWPNATSVTLDRNEGYLCQEQPVITDDYIWIVKPGIASYNRCFLKCHNDLLLIKAKKNVSSTAVRLWLSATATERDRLPHYFHPCKGTAIKITRIVCYSCKTGPPPTSVTGNIFSVICYC